MSRAISTALHTDPVVPDITTITNVADFGAMEEEWNDLVTAHNNSLFLRHEFLRVWFESFAPGERLEILTGWSSGRLVAALPLIRQRGSIRGMPMLEMAGTSNAHSGRFDMIAEDP